MNRFAIGVVALCLCVFSLNAYAADMSMADKLGAQEKALWEAIKNGDMKTFSAGTAPDILDVDATGVIYNKQQIMDTFMKMKMTDFSLTDFNTFMLDKDCVVLSYKSTSTATMDGKTMTMNVTNTTTYVNQGGKWIPKFHTETMVPSMDMK